MESPSTPRLPLPLEALPEALRRVVDPKAPGPARLMAARGLVPLKGGQMVSALLQLAADADEAVATQAKKTLAELPNEVLNPACEADLHASFLHGIYEHFGKHETVARRLATNHAVPSRTIAEMALHCSEQITEIIATNQQRLLEAPEIIEALYKNSNARMSTVERLIELAARHNLVLDAIPSFEEHVNAIRGGLIPEPSDEPLPSDEVFSEALAEDGEEVAVATDKVTGEEEVIDEFVPLQAKIRMMNIGEKLRLAFLGNASARSILVRDPNKVVSYAAISAPTVSETEARNVAHSREVSEDVLRFIGKKKEWARSYEIKKALCYNPKTPLALSMGMLVHLRRNDVRALARSRGIPQPLKDAARRRSQKYS